MSHVEMVSSRGTRSTGMVADQQDPSLRSSRLVAELREERDFIAAVLETVGALVIVIDRAGCIVHFNPACEHSSGYSADEMRGTRGWEWLLDEAEIPLVRSAFADIAAGRFPNTSENDWIARDGTRRRISWSNTAALDARGEVRYVIGTGLDVTERNSLEQQLKRLALHDQLTGLPNRSLFLNRLDEALNGERGPGFVAVLYLDLDGFKLINDTLGHEAGDRVLAEVATRLTTVVGERDTVARIGGDEFTVLLPDAADVSAVAATAERLAAVIARPVVTAGRSLSVSASIGIALRDRAPATADIISDADVAMYQAKAAGKGQWRLFEPGMRAAAWARLAQEVVTPGS